jgi:branched-chain amino acid transport system substrate-binding protein
MHRFALALVAAGLAAAAAPAPAAEKLSDGKVKLGVLTDMTGYYADLAGPGSVLAARMAVEDFGGKVLGKPVELVSADHQLKADVASNIARKWIDEGQVDAIVDLVSSSTAGAVMPVAAEKKRITLLSGPGTTAFTGEKCTRYNVHYTYNNWALANGTGREVVKQGGDSWFFLTADYIFGKSLEEDTTKVVKAAGGKVLGSVRHPFPGSDFSTFLLQAQSSGAKVIGLANAASDMTTTIKQANEFGITPKQRLASMIAMITDVHAMGLKVTQGMISTDGFYWDLNDETRAWSRRFFERHKRMPTMIQAGVYSATLHYLKAIKAAGTDEPGTVMAKMKATPVNDFFAKNGKIRADGRMVHDMLLTQVKTPAESKYPWDYYKVLKVIPGDEAYLPLSRSVCPLVKK